ncbi:MAG: lipid-A-disaccharide synthase, partial [Planctomycetota bacterium]|nr:lipid-A-disaccharide synthase [Planctomycetota bacterium]
MTPAAPPIYLSTGEISGEMHAAALLQALQRLAPGLRCTAMGEEILRAAGAEIVCPTHGLRVMGFAEVCWHGLTLYRLFRAAAAHIAAAQPAVAVLVDYPGFHLRLARAIRQASPRTRVVYYIAPKAWAWHEGRVRYLRKYVHRLLCIFPFEQAWFQERGVAALYVGNPTLEAMRNLPPREATRAELGLSGETRLVAIFPGSRQQEIRRMLPILLEAAKLLGQRFGIGNAAASSSAGLAFALALAPGIDAAELQRASLLPPWLRLSSSSVSLLAAADIALAKSGTITLEAALALVPTVVIYRAHPLSAWLGRYLVKVPYFSLPNPIAGRPVIPELFQEEATADNIAAAASAWLENAAQYEEARAGLRQVRE